MARFVLVGGFWLGAWAWADVATRLRARGHEARVATLSGLGEDRDALRPEIDLETHIADVARLIEAEDLREVMLVGHSYGGIVITGAADRIAERLARLVYVDAGPIPNGSAMIDLFTPEARAVLEDLIARQGEGWRLPLPPWDVVEGTMEASLAGIDEAGRERFRRLATDQPAATMRTPLRLVHGASPALPKVAILNTTPLATLRQMIAQGVEFFLPMAGPEWRFLEEPTGHWPMLSEPEILAERLDEAGRGGGVPL